MIVLDRSAAMEMARNTSRGTGFRMLALKVSALLHRI